MSPGFLNELHAVRIGKKKWRLLSPLRYLSMVKGYPVIYEVPAGKESDGESVPAVPVVHEFLVEESTLPCGVLHDDLYGSGREPREICDAIYLESLESVSEAEKNGTLRKAVLSRSLPVAVMDISKAYIERAKDVVRNIAKWLGVRMAGWFFYNRGE